MYSVLIVDDEAGIRDILRRWLIAAGYEVREASDARSALAQMNAAQADVVISDVNMPGPSGAWLREEIGRRFPATVVVLASALAASADASDAQARAVPTLVKPLAKIEVLEAVARSVGARPVTRPPDRS
jgi:DNA-binding NtrC family response regulator